MNQAEIIGVIGEILLWAGVICGMPLLIAGVIIAIAAPRAIEVPLTVVEGVDELPIAFWTVGERTYSAPMSGMRSRRQRLTASGQTLGYVTSRHPDRLRFERLAPAAGVCLRLAAGLLAAALLGELLGYAPHVFGSD